MQGSRREEGPWAFAIAKELSIVGKGMIYADDPGDRPAFVRRERRVSNGMSGFELSRSEVKTFQDETGLTSFSTLAMTRTRKLECWARTERIEFNWERIVSGEDSRRRMTRFR